MGYLMNFMLIFVKDAPNHSSSGSFRLKINQTITHYEDKDPTINRYMTTVVGTNRSISSLFK